MSQRNSVKTTPEKMSRKNSIKSPPGGVKALSEKFNSGNAFNHSNHMSQRDVELELLRHSGLVSKASSHLEALLQEERDLLEREGLGSLIRELLRRKLGNGGSDEMEEVCIRFQFMSC